MWRKVRLQKYYRNQATIFCWQDTACNWVGGCEDPSWMLQSTVILLRCVCFQVNIFAMKSVFPGERGNCFCSRDNVTCWHSDTIIQPLKLLAVLLWLCRCDSGVRQANGKGCTERSRSSKCPDLHHKRRNSVQNKHRLSTFPSLSPFPPESKRCPSLTVTIGGG